MKLNLSARGFAFAAAFRAHPHEIRHYLCGVYVAPVPADAGGGVLIAGCDGHTLGLWRDPQGECDRAAILRVDKGLASACQTQKYGRIVLAGDRLACLDKVGNEVFVQPAAKTELKWEVPGKFPDIARVVPDNPEVGVLACLNPLYLERVGKAFRAACTTHFPACSVSLRQVDVHSAVLIQAPNIPEALAVVMPFRQEHINAPWVGRWKRSNDRRAAAMAAPAPAMPSDAEPPRGFVKAKTAKVPEGGAA